MSIPIDVDNESNLEEGEIESYASVASNLCVAIIDQRPEISMTLHDQKKFDTLHSSIIDLILSQTGKNLSSPQFDVTRLHSGTMRVRCANLPMAGKIHSNIE